MQVNKLGNYKTSNTTFKGRVQIPNEQFFAKMIEGMSIFDIRRVEAELRREEQKLIPVVKKSLISKWKNRFSTPKLESNPPAAPKTLKDFWDESLNTMKTLAITRLPDDYVLRCRKSNLGQGSMSFSITKGREHIYGVSAFINNPKFPEKCIDEAVERISQGQKAWG